LKLFHRTTAEKAAAILTGGFKDATGHYITDEERTGVWFSSVPLDENEGARGDTLLEVIVDLSADDLADYEWVEEGKPYREWLIPAALINATMTIAVRET
jgi:hypothetical protein